MDPITFSRLGQIRQQEFLDDARRDHEGYVVGYERGIVALLQRVRDFFQPTLEGAHAQARANEPACPPYPNVTATSR